MTCSPISHTIAVNSTWWVPVGVKRIKNQDFFQQKELRCIPPSRTQWGSGCGPWNNRTKEKFEKKEKSKKKTCFFFQVAHRTRIRTLARNGCQVVAHWTIEQKKNQDFFFSKNLQGTNRTRASTRARTRPIYKVANLSKKVWTPQIPEITQGVVLLG